VCVCVCVCVCVFVCECVYVCVCARAGVSMYLHTHVCRYTGGNVLRGRVLSSPFVSLTHTHTGAECVAATAAGRSFMCLRLYCSDRRGGAVADLAGLLDSHFCYRFPLLPPSPPPPSRPAPSLSVSLHISPSRVTSRSASCAVS